MSLAQNRTDGSVSRSAARLWLARLGRAFVRRDLAGAAHRFVLRVLSGLSPRLGEALRYRLWIGEHERPSLRLPVTATTTPKVSVVPTHATVELRALAGDLRPQVGVEWELCPLPGQDAPDLPGNCLRPALRSGGHPLAAGLQAATGEIVLLVDPWTRLAPDALAALVGAIEGPQALAYADVDHVSGHGRRRCAPFFKPSVPGAMLWSLDLLAPVTAFNRSLAATAGAAIEGDAPALGLRLELAGTAPRICHVPRVLAHRELAPKAEPTDWRLVGAAAVAAVRRHVATHHQGWEVTEDQAGRVRVRPPLPDDTLVSIIIPTRDRADLLRACVDAIRRHTPSPRFELLVVDTGSTEADAVAQLTELAAQRDVRVLAAPGRFNWSGANNLAVRSARGNVLLFLNNDTEVQEPGWLEELAAWALADGVGTVGALLCRADGTVQHAGVGIGFGGLCAHPFEGLRPEDVTIAGPAAAYRSCVAVTGACMAVSRWVFDLLGGFDERFHVLFSDMELGARAWVAGLPSMVSPHARLVHHHGRSRGTDDLMIPSDILAIRDIVPFELISSDPAWSPHLSRWSALPRLVGMGEPDPLAVVEAFAAELRTTFSPEQRAQLQAVAPIFGEVWHRPTCRSDRRTP